MNIVTLPKKEYKNLIRRQAQIEKELAALRGVVRDEIEEKKVRPSALRRWEKISNSLDKGKGKTFISIETMRKWLRTL